jgi:hypothetical protein
MRAKILTLRVHDSLNLSLRGLTKSGILRFLWSAASSPLWFPTFSSTLVKRTCFQVVACQNREL